ncbi:cation:proton antiporter [uncultured Ramlibacter sp.]|uniref:cation:proton antiporter n=1 Tax=uncultured Ramlibacter sp. TaxID=260755 RepID=UPI002630D6F2|nr:cation:proton antiporter [uncultured Ramlibacter sp.]
MHSAGFIQDLAVIMLIAGLVTIVFHRLKQPVVLGYILAGVIIGPHTPPFALVSDEHTIRILSELGVVFLLFSLGLEFSLRKLAAVGMTAVVAAVTEIAAMLAIGFGLGQWFGWSRMDSIFLGAILSISSTTIIVKALSELQLKNQRFAQLIFGVLIVEDILAIAMIALLSALATTGEVDAPAVFGTLGRLSLFMVVSLVLGILVVPRLLDSVAKAASDEMLLITVLGLCFGFCLLVVKLEYSIALGAFVIGAVMAESRQLRLIERLTGPLRDMFSAIFFVSIGLLLDPGVLLAYAGPIAIITAAVVLGKVLSCAGGSYLAGNDGRTSVKVGMGLAQIGEFSFIIASLGLTLKVTSDFLYPIAVAVSALTTLFTPYLIRLSDPLSLRAAAAMPTRLSAWLGRYPAWLARLSRPGDAVHLRAIIGRIVLQVLVNFALIAAVFIAGAYAGSQLGGVVSLPLLDDPRVSDALAWSAALLVSLPFLIAAYRKLKALAMLLAEMLVRSRVLRRAMEEVIPAAGVAGILALIGWLSASILPPWEWLAGILAGAAVVTAVLWQRFVRLHTRLQLALIETMQAHSSPH